MTGRRYERVSGYRVEDADYVIVGQGSVVPSAEAVADYLRDTRNIRVGVINLLMFRPFPGDLVGRLLKNKRGVVVLERLDQPLAEDLPIIREIRAAIYKCVENGKNQREKPFPLSDTYLSLDDIPDLYSGSFGLGSRDLQPEGLIAAIENMLPGGAHRKHFYL